MTSFIVIRYFSPGDEIQCSEIIRKGVMSTVTPAFITALTREVTFQMIVLTSAVMFIFVGIPFTFSLCSVPVIIITVYFCVWSSHSYKSFEITQDLMNVSKIYTSSDCAGFWVAELYEPYFMTKDPSLQQFTIMAKSDVAMKSHVDLSSLRKQIVGTVAIVRSKCTENYAWLRRLVVKPKYQRKGIATALLKEVFQFCKENNYTGVELVTTECNDNARILYIKRGFELKQMYYKYLLGNVVSMMVYELYYNFHKNEMSTAQKMF